MNIKNSIFAVLTALILVLTVACGAPAEQKWDGVWKADGYEATIQNNQIEVHIINDGTDALFWKGTFEPGTDVVKEGAKVSSAADEGALSMSLFGSRSKDKDFQVKDGKLHFDLSMMGVKKNVQLSKA